MAEPEDHTEAINNLRIAVSDLRGDLREYQAALQGRMTSIEEQNSRVEYKINDHERRMTTLEKSWARMMGALVGSGLLGGGTGALILKAVSSAGG